MPDTSGSTYANFVVKISEAMNEPILVTFHTEDGSGIAGVDYEAVIDGEIIFNEGETEKNIQILCYGRSASDSVESRTFTLVLDPQPDVILRHSSENQITISVVSDDTGGTFLEITAATGRKGLPGLPGLSAYQVAVLAGYSGTVTQWLESLHGEPVELRISDDNNYIQWRLKSDNNSNTWENLISTSKLVPNGIGELVGRVIEDIVGDNWFIDDGFLVKKTATANQFSIAAGIGYISGFRAELESEQFINVTSYPQFVYLDVYSGDSASSEWKTQISTTVSDKELEDYVDANGDDHYLCKIAKITAADNAIDMRGGSQLLLEQIATSYALDINLGGKWSRGETLNVGDWRYFNQQVWAPNADGALCGVSPDISYFHIIYSFSKGMKYCETENQIQDANNLIVNNAKRMKIKAFSESNITLTGDSLLLNTSFISFDGDGCVLDASALPDTFAGDAMLIRPTAVGREAYRQGINYLKNFELIGSNSAGKQAVGLAFDCLNGSGSAGRITVSNAHVHGFNVGVDLRNRAYALNFDHVHIWDNTTDIYMAGGLTDYGENNSFKNGASFNSGTNVDINNSSSSTFFDNWSFDYSNVILKLVGGYVKMTNSHAETNSSDIVFQISGNGALCEFDGWLQKTNDGIEEPYPTHIASVGIDSVLKIRGRLNNCITSTGEFYTGEGVVDIKGHSFKISGVPRVKGTAAIIQKIKNYTFAALPTEAFVVTGTDFTSQWASDVGAITVDNNQLVFTKIAAGGTDFYPRILIPFETLEAAGYKFDWLNSSAGNAFCSSRWGQVNGYDSNGQPNISATGNVVTDHGTLSPGGRGTIVIDGTSLNRKPEWATHLVITFNFFGLGAGTEFRITSPLYATAIM